MYFFRRQYGNVVFVDRSRFLLDQFGVGLSLQLFARQPEEHVLLAELGAQKVAKIFPPLCNTGKPHRTINLCRSTRLSINTGQGLGKARSGWGGQLTFAPTEICSWCQQLRMALMSDGCQSNDIVHLPYFNTLETMCQRSHIQRNELSRVSGPLH